MGKIWPCIRGPFSTIRQGWRVALAAGAFLYFFTGGAFLSWVLLPLGRLGVASEHEKRNRCQRMVQRAFLIFHAYMRHCGLVNFNPRSARLSQPHQPVVIVANHPTLVDTTAMLAAYDRLCVVTKASLHQSPLLGPLLRYCGHIDSGDVAFQSVFEMIEQAKTRLSDGYSVLIFPERTRSPIRTLHRFRRGAFELAQQAGAPILPVFIYAEPPALKRGQPWWDIPRESIQFRLVPGALILPHDQAGQPRDSHTLRSLAHAFIAENHQRQCELEPRPDCQNIGLGL